VVVLPASVNRGQHLIGGPARVPLAIVHAAEPDRQGRAEPRPEYRDDEIGIGGLGDLVRKVLVGRVKVLFPPDGFDPDAILEQLVQPGGDVVDPLPLDRDIAGRRDEHPYFVDTLIVSHCVAP
jgi:hypothetical protein